MWLTLQPWLTLRVTDVTKLVSFFTLAELGDRGPRARSCTSRTFGSDAVSPLGGAEILGVTGQPQIKTPVTLGPHKRISQNFNTRYLTQRKDVHNPWKFRKCGTKHAKGRCVYIAKSEKMLKFSVKVDSTPNITPISAACRACGAQIL